MAKEKTRKAKVAADESDEMKEGAERIDLDVHADDTDESVIVREEDVLGILGKDA